LPILNKHDIHARGSRAGMVLSLIEVPPQEFHRPTQGPNSFQFHWTRCFRGVNRYRNSALISSMDQSQSEITRGGGDQRSYIRGQSVDKRVGAAAFETTDGILAFDLAKEWSSNRSRELRVLHLW
jgi:hypothetical protein